MLKAGTVGRAVLLKLSLSTRRPEVSDLYDKRMQDARDELESLRGCFQSVS